MARIGVFACWCGHNIASTVDIERLSGAASKMRGVACARDHKYMCGREGQRMIADAVRSERLTGLVIAGCSPRMHEKTWHRAATAAGLNPYLVEIANIREQCSWVHDEREAATAKAIDTVRMAVARARRGRALSPVKVPVTQRALVIGGGIAGIEAALSMADAGVEVVIVEKEPSLGGRMAQLGETFPTLDCSQCILTPKMVEAADHPRITLMTCAEVEKLEGFVGNFTAAIRRKARYVNPDLCTGCGECIEKCPVRTVPNSFDRGLSARSAVYRPFLQAVPDKVVIDARRCLKLTTGGCGLCERICPTGAVDYADSDETMMEKFGAVVVATGFDVAGVEEFGEYGHGKYPDVVTSLEFERMEAADGPTGGEIVRPSDGREPQSVVFVQCAGSRDEARGRAYCSKICCMYTAKHAILYRQKVKRGKAYVFYVDVRAGGKMYEEFARRAVEDAAATYLRGRVSRVYRDGDALVVKGIDTLLGRHVEIRADLVVLATAAVAQPGAAELARTLGISFDGHGFYSEAHAKLRPVETARAGVFLAGACTGPRDIPESVASGSAAAAKALALLGADTLEREPLVAQVFPGLCAHCGACIKACPCGAIEEVSVRDRGSVRIVARVNDGACQGCGVCAALCRAKAIRLAGYDDAQVYEEIGALGGL